MWQGGTHIIIPAPFDARLKTHKLTGIMDDLWSARVSFKIRLVFSMHDAATKILQAVGDHKIYD